MTPTTTTRYKTSTALKAAFAALVLTSALSTQAGATSLAVKMACASDYYALCSQHAPDTPGVRQCMRAHGSQLSKGCVNALIGAGEVSKAEVERRRAAKFASKASKSASARTAAAQ